MRGAGKRTRAVVRLGMRDEEREGGEETPFLRKAFRAIRLGIQDLISYR